MRRTAFIALPLWPTERLRPPPDASAPKAPPPPTALVAAGARGVRLVAVDARAAALGLAPGQPLADARALVPALQCRPHAPAAEVAALDRLARWCGRFSPAVAPWAAPGPGLPMGLALDATGLARLFGGEGRWLAGLLARLRGFGLTACGALADAPGAAYALAVADPRARAPVGLIAPPGAGLDPLLRAPVAALRLPPGVVEALRALGLKEVGALARAPRASLSRRFGPGLLTRLDQAAGRLAEPIDPLEPEAVFGAALRFAALLTTAEALTHAAERLTAKLARRLAAAGLGARRLVWLLYRADGETVRLTCAAARPLTRPADMLRLVRQRLAAVEGTLDLGFGVDAARLIATSVEAPRAEVQPLDPAAAAHADAAADAADLADRLAARLGAGAVGRLAPVASHDPFRAQRWASVLEPASGFDPVRGARRPLLLLTPPEPIAALAEAPDGPPRQFRWRRVLHRVARAEGLERISPEWWRGAPGPDRDFHRVETLEGRWFWLCREGAYDDPAPARWLLAGAG